MYKPGVPSVGVLAGSALALAASPAGTHGIDALSALVLGIVQGIAEFLPISSSGHLALAELALGIDAEAGGHRFNIAVHAGTLLAVLIVFHRDLVALVGGARKPGPERDTLVAIVISSLPLALVLIPGVDRLVFAVERDARGVGLCLLATAAALWCTHRASPGLAPRETVPTGAQAGIVGIAQLVAILPGISRSGSTIAAGLAAGMSRTQAARYSFLISIPAVAAATLHEGVSAARHPDAVSVQAVPLAIGFGAALVVGVASLGALLQIVERWGLLLFVPYLLVVGAAACAYGAGVFA